MKAYGNKKNLKIAVLLISVVLLVFTGLGLWLYNGQLSPAKVKIFSLLPLPMAIVGGHNVPMSQFLLRYALAEKVLGSGVANSNSEQIKNGIYSQIIAQAQAEAVAGKYGVSVDQSQIDAEYQAQTQQSSSQQQQDPNATLQSYGADQELFKNQVIKPQLLMDNLQIWFNSQQQLNPQLYQQANSLQAKIQSGGDMGALATSFSQDQTGQAVSGDLGFVDVSQLLPELREPIASMKIGDIKVLPSRYGLHIIRLEATNNNLLHLRQIFLANPAFQSWYQSQTQKIKIEKLINI